MPDFKPVKKNWAFRVAAVLLSIMFTLSLLELGAWFFLHKKWPRKTPVPNNEWVILTGRGRRLQPNLNIEMHSEISGRQVRFRTNSLGLRGPEIDIEKKPGVKRILVLGDSITLSAFLPEDEVYPALLEKTLSSKFPVQVINAGISGADTKEELYIYKETGRRLKPDLVLVGFYLNDSRPPWGFENEFYRLPPWLIETSKVVDHYSYLYRWVWKRFLVTHFMGRGRFSSQDWYKEYRNTDWRNDKIAYQNLIKAAPMDFGVAWQESSWRIIYKLIDELDRLVKKDGSKLAVLIFPVEIQVRSRVADDFPQQKMLAYCKERNIPCLDLLPIIREYKDQDIYFDHCHLNTLGHGIISPKIASFLEQNFFSKTTDP